MARLALILLICAAFFSAASSAHGQGFSDPAELIAAQRDAMSSLSFMDGIWRGTAWTLLPNGQRHDIIQTERVGPFLDGTVKVIEGRGYESDGTLSFNALAIISYSPADRNFTIRSYAQGYAGNYRFTPNDSGFVWEIPAGEMIIRFTANIQDGNWHEVGERIMPGQDPMTLLEMNLTRIGQTDWPAAGAVTPR